MHVQVTDTAAAQEPECICEGEMLSATVQPTASLAEVKALHSGTIETGGQDGPASDWVRHRERLELPRLAHVQRLQGPESRG